MARTCDYFTTLSGGPSKVVTFRIRSREPAEPVSSSGDTVYIVCFVHHLCVAQVLFKLWGVGGMEIKTDSLLRVLSYTAAGDLSPLS